MLDKIFSLFEKLDRQRHIQVLKNHPKTFLDGNIKLGTGNKFVLHPELGKISIGKGFDIRDSVHILVHEHAQLEIGARVFMNNFCSINCLESVKIGDDTLFGENVKIYDHNHAYNKTAEGTSISRSEFTKAPVVIGRNCWLGSNVTVLKGVTIGNHCIIGAGCTIFKDIPENTTVVSQQQLIFK